MFRCSRRSFSNKVLQLCSTWRNKDPEMAAWRPSLDTRREQLRSIRSPTRSCDLDYVVKHRPVDNGQVSMPCWGFMELGWVVEDFSWIHAATRDSAPPADLFETLRFSTIEVCSRSLRYNPVTMDGITHRVLTYQWESEYPDYKTFAICNGNRRQNSIRAFYDDKYESWHARYVGTNAKTATTASNGTNLVRAFVLKNLDRCLPNPCRDCTAVTGSEDARWHMRRKQSSNAFEVHYPNCKAAPEMFEIIADLEFTVGAYHLPCFEDQETMLALKLNDLRNKVRSVAHRKTYGEGSAAAADLGYVYGRSGAFNEVSA